MRFTPQRQAPLTSGRNRPGPLLESNLVPVVPRADASPTRTTPIRTTHKELPLWPFPR